MTDRDAIRLGMRVRITRGGDRPRPLGGLARAQRDTDGNSSKHAHV
jgi:hypothetical protein